MADPTPGPGQGGGVPVAPLPEAWAIGVGNHGATGVPLVMVAISGPYGQLVHWLDRTAAKKVAADILDAAERPVLHRPGNGKL